jgi:hypothetical protein
MMASQTCSIVIYISTLLMEWSLIHLPSNRFFSEKIAFAGLAAFLSSIAKAGEATILRWFIAELFHSNIFDGRCLATDKTGMIIACVLAFGRSFR